MTRPITIRAYEWSRVDASHLTAAQRRDVQAATDTWQLAAGLAEPPITFAGADGSTLCTCQHVGVVEVDEVTIEILPKLDAQTESRPSPDSGSVRRVMDNLLWMLASCGYMELTEADRANLKRDDVRFVDLFAYLFAKNLLLQLEAGVPHAYVAHQADLQAVRGAINFSDQITRNWNRMDRISCRWDEFTSDTPLNRVLKCATTMLRYRVGNQAARRVLEECLVYFEDTSQVDPQSALHTAQAIRWDRANDRLRPCFDLAVRLLAGDGFQMTHANLRTFVFLLDMNKVFEAFVGAVLNATYRVPVLEQQHIGYLLTGPGNSIRQLPDFLWTKGSCHWIGDAKYKRLDRTAADAWDEDHIQNTSVYLGPADIRQLTVYAEMHRRKHSSEMPPRLAVFFPVVGDNRSAITRKTAWNGSPLDIVPVRVDREWPLTWCTELNSAD